MMTHTTDLGSDILVSLHSKYAECIISDEILNGTYFKSEALLRLKFTRVLVNTTLENTVKRPAIPTTDFHGSLSTRY